MFLARTKISARDRLATLKAEREGKRLEHARMLAESVLPDEELEALEFAAAIEDAVEQAREMLARQAADLEDEADELDEDAAVLRARLAELDVEPQEIARLDEQVRALSEAAAELHAKVVDAVLAGRPEAAIRRIEILRDARRGEVVEAEAELATLREQIEEAARLRGEATMLTDRAVALRVRAQQIATDGIAALPAIAREFALRERERRQLLRSAPRDTQPPQRPILLGTNGLRPDHEHGLLHGDDGLVINTRSGAVAWFR